MKNRHLILALSILSILFMQGTDLAQIHNKIDASNSHPHLQNSKITRRLQNRLFSLYETEKSLNVWIYLRDKGITTQALLNQKLLEVRQNLKAPCIWRRMKVRSQENLVDYSDLPLFLSYLKKVIPLVNRVRIESRWLNAISAEVSVLQIHDLSELDFVRRIDLVTSFQRNEPQGSVIIREEQSHLNIDYGSSFAQLDQINVLPLHQLGYSGKGVLVCMLDTGFRKSHEIFEHANLVAEWDFVNNDDDVQQDLLDPDDYTDSHGTGTWSTLGGYESGELVGPAYGADFLLAKTETTKFERPIEEDYWVAGVEWAEALGAEVLSSSLGYTDWYTFEDMDGETAATTIAANRAVSLGVVVVNAVGNERNEPWGHLIAPSDGYDVISAGAVDSEGNISSFSSPGPTYDRRIKPEVCALGVDNRVAANREDGSDYYRRGSGTSFATPLVAGVAALLLEIHRDWTPAQVRSALLSTSSRSSNPDNDYGWGIINAALAANLDFALPKLQSFTIDDDSSGESTGNGNGRAEAGETIEIHITLTNESNVTAFSLEASLSATHPEFRITNSTITFPSLSPSTSGSSEKPFVIKIPASFLGHHAVFRLIVEGANSITLYESLRISVSR